MPEPEPQGGCLDVDALNFAPSVDFDDGSCRYCANIGLGAECRLSGCQWDRDDYVCLDACSRRSCATCASSLSCYEAGCLWDDGRYFCDRPCGDIGCFACGDGPSCAGAGCFWVDDVDGLAQTDDAECFDR